MDNRTDCCSNSSAFAITKICLSALSGCPLQLEMLEKLENEPFFSWKSWNFLGLIMINGIIG